MATRNEPSGEGRPSDSKQQAANNNYSWRNPAPEKMKKYGLVSLGDDFEPTPQEQRLLDMYDTVKAYEKQAAMLRKDAALRKLQARNADFLQKSKRKTVKRKQKKKAVLSGVDEENTEEGSDEEEDDDDDDDDDNVAPNDGDGDEPVTEAKLQEWREEVEEAKAKAGNIAKKKEAEMIAEHLTEDADENDDLANTVLLKKRKTVPETTDGASSSLLFNMKPDQTPQHEFSSRFGLEPSRGTILFPANSTEDDDNDQDLLNLAGIQKSDNKVWEPPEGAVGPNDSAFLTFLEDFDLESGASNGSSGNNTLAIKFEVPQESKRFSLNIAQADQAHNDFDSILFHFNPRQRERGGQVVMNDKEGGIWGQALSIPLSQLPVIFGKDACTLQIQITPDGFDVFFDDLHCARLEHRQDLLASENSRLCLQFPSTDDYGNPENWKVFKVWWGFKPVMAKSEKLSEVAGVNSFNSIHPRKLFLRGLPKLSSSTDIDIRRAELERAFGKYGGSRGVVKVVVYNRKTYATVELETERLADLALQELSSIYQINRARRTKHEALQEERLLKEQAKAGGSRKDISGWD